MVVVSVVLVYLPELSSSAFVSRSSKTQRMILPMPNIVASSISCFYQEENVSVSSNVMFQQLRKQEHIRTC